MTVKVPTSDGPDNQGLYGGIVLGLAAIAALIVANSPLGPHYDALLRTTGEVRIGSIGLSKTIDHWINDGLMAVFFLLVVLEIKREAIEGALASPKKAALPVIAAFGGFVTPAAIFAAVNWGNAEALRGWAIPAATDIAFALGVCAMLGRKVPASLKTFLLALAIIDDLMAIIVIAIFYTADLSVTALALGGLGVAALAVLNLLDVQTIVLSDRGIGHLGLRTQIRRPCDAGRRRRRSRDANDQARRPQPARRYRTRAQAVGDFHHRADFRLRECRRIASRIDLVKAGGADNAWHYRRAFRRQADRGLCRFDACDQAGSGCDAGRNDDD